MDKNQLESERMLAEFLKSENRLSEGMDLDTLRGVYYALACCPEFLPANFIYQVPFGFQEVKYADMAEMNRVVKALGDFYGEIQVKVNKRLAEPPPGYKDFQESPKTAILEKENRLQKWSDGFIIGRNLTEEIWRKHRNEYNEIEHDRCVMVLSFFSDIEIAREYYDLFKRQTGSFSEFAEMIYEAIPEAMASYADMGRTLYEGALKLNLKKNHDNINGASDINGANSAEGLSDL